MKSPVTSELRIDGQRLWQSIMTMAQIGPGTKGGSHRLTLTDEDKQGRDLFVKWCRDEGCSISVDDMGNIFARREGTNNELAPIVAGSHLDTQPHGGKFDGVYGVLAALEVIRTLNQHQIQTRAPIEVVNWTNEEGSRFAPAMIASGVFAGLFEKQYAYSRTDSNGLSIADELERIGYLGEQPCGEHQIGALIEPHIEQGPILERNHQSIGVVTGAQGVRWFDITIQGQDAHAGTTPMPTRKDALVAACQVIQLVQQIATDHAPDAVGTVGELSLQPNSRNSIPGEVFLTVDLRHPDDAVLSNMADTLQNRIKAETEQSGLNLKMKEIWHNPPIKFDPSCIQAVSQATKMLGYAHTQMISGAGHDACQICRVAPTAMIFVPCAGGLSHTEKESAEPQDLEAGCNVLLHTLLQLAA